MPIFEYVCRTCDHRFELIVNRATTPNCPSCASDQLEKQLSVFAVNTGGRHADVPVGGACGTCGDPRGPGSCALN